MAERCDQNMSSHKKMSKRRGKAQKDSEDLNEKLHLRVAKHELGMSPDASTKHPGVVPQDEMSSDRNVKDTTNSVSLLEKQDITLEVIDYLQNKIFKCAFDGNERKEKTREEILAEREAKKLAKQALKKKLKEGSVAGNALKGGSSTSKDALPLVQNTQKEKTFEVNKSNTDNTKIQMKDRKETDVESTNQKANEEKTKAQLRAERRAIQEIQRAKKMEKLKTAADEEVNSAVSVIKPEKQVIQVNKTIREVPDKIHKVKLFAHLYTELFNCKEIDLCENIHPSILRLGTQYRSKVISGANARCLALLNALKTVVHDYETPVNQEFSRGLEAEISKSIIFLNKCRPLAVSMANAVKHLRFQVNQLKGDEAESKKQINDWMETYIKEQIDKAAEAISLFVLGKITDGDVILTYSCSSLVQRTLIKAREKKIKFRVIIVDGLPWLEGKEMLRRLVKAGISCTYVFFNGLSFIMPEVTKILLGAHALLANGYVMSRAGSSQIALMAKVYNVPVLVCCETHKFSEKVQTDSFVHNELGDPDRLVSSRGCDSKELSKWKTIQNLTPLNLTYDVTPPDLVSAVVTEIAVLPCTSVPVILRVKPPDVTC